MSEGDRVADDLNAGAGDDTDIDLDKQTVEIAEVLLPARTLRISVWFLCGVVLAWVPLTIDVLLGDEGNNHVGFFQSLSHGELLLLASVTSAGALGELFITVARDGGDAIKRKMLLAGVLLVEFMLTAMGYAVVRYQSEPTASQQGHIAVWSMALFAVTFTMSLCAMLFVEKDS